MSFLIKYKTIAKSISLLLHPFAEVVIHDLKKNKIAAIYNSFSKRKVGDESHIKNPVSFESGPEVHGPFINENFYGYCVKYTTTILRDEKGKAVGLLCTNINIEHFQTLKNTMNLFMENQSNSSKLDALFNDDWQEKIRSFVEMFLKDNNRSQSRLSKKERMELVAALHAAGAFNVKNAHGFTAKVLKVTRATIYNYLTELGLSADC